MIRFNKFLIQASLFITFLLPLQMFAQQFSYTTRLAAVDSTGFYAIPLSPLLSAYLNTDMTDIRIADQNKLWVPHILQQRNAKLEERQFTEFPIIQNTVTDSGSNFLVIQNTKQQGIYNFRLFLKNAAVSRTAALSGSNNQRDWYIIDDNIQISRSYETIKDDYLQEINFPLMKYAYLKLVIDNFHNDPLLITRAGCYEQATYKRPAVYQTNPTPLFLQKDSNNYSYIEIRQDKNYQFDRVSIGIEGPQFYSREIEMVYAGTNKKIGAKKGTTIGNFKIYSGTPAIFDIPRIKASLFYLLVKNDDNPPLKIKEVNTSQQGFDMVAYLEKGKQYDLLLGDSLAKTPVYDLQLFKDSVRVLKALSYGVIQPVETRTNGNAGGSNNWWIWPALFAAIFALSYLTFRLVNDIGKTNK